MGAGAASIAAETPVYDACSRGLGCPSASARDWLALLGRLGDAAPMDQLRAVNAFLNRFPYRSDLANYGRRDYWATPLEFLARSGDCEDYAIAKYVSLRRLGVPAGRLRIAVVQDEDRDSPHAVLLADVGGTWYVLDNLSERVEPQERVGHYVRYYSLNEDGFWTRAPARPDGAPGAGGRGGADGAAGLKRRGRAAFTIHIGRGYTPASAPRPSLRDMTLTAAPELDELRREVDRIDRSILELLAARLRVVAEIAQVKGAGSGQLALRPAREALIMRRLVDGRAGDFPKAALLRMWRELLGAMTPRPVAARGSRLAAAGAARVARHGARPFRLAGAAAPADGAGRRAAAHGARDGAGGGAAGAGRRGAMVAALLDGTAAICGWCRGCRSRRCPATRRPAAPSSSPPSSPSRRATISPSWRSRLTSAQPGSSSCWPL